VTAADGLDELVGRAEAELAAADSPAALERVRAAWLGRKGELSARMKELAALPPEARRAQGARLNAAKARLEAAARARAAALADAPEGSQLDVTFPARVRLRGSEHPVPAAIEELCAIFRGMGFERAEGPEADTERNNFDLLNTPADHPARDLQDTFYLPGGGLLRTHTSAVWAREMARRAPPLRIVCPGRVFRRDALDASHSPCFFQLEGLWIDSACRFSDLKGVLEDFLREWFGGNTAVRFEPRYFPFTEPSAEVSVRCTACEGAGCRTCGRTGWLELLGCGMVHPEILAAHGGPWAAEGIRGFAFGVGVERLVMMRHGIADLRWLYDNDLRVLGRGRR
jgi:phenylalanyl-tRNA synthetase alpha chain